MYYKYFSWFEFFLGLVITPAKMLWGLVMFDWERAFYFSTLAKTYTQWPTVRCQKGISAWPYVIVLHHRVTLVSRCDIFMVWDIPSGLYSFLKQQGCCACVKQHVCAMSCSHPVEEQISKGHVWTACWVWNTCAPIVISCEMLAVNSSFSPLFSWVEQKFYCSILLQSPYSKCWRRDNHCCHPSLTEGWNLCLYATYL